VIAVGIAVGSLLGFLIATSDKEERIYKERYNAKMLSEIEQHKGVNDDNSEQTFMN
jgi:hypothetical protein